MTSRYADLIIEVPDTKLASNEVDYKNPRHGRRKRLNILIVDFKTTVVSNLWNAYQWWCARFVITVPKERIFSIQKCSVLCKKIILIGPHGKRLKTPALSHTFQLTD
jgi:hypothetical protein